MTNAVIESASRKEARAQMLRLRAAAGAAGVKKALLLLKVGRLPEDFIEGSDVPGRLRRRTEQHGNRRWHSRKTVTL